MFFIYLFLITLDYYRFDEPGIHPFELKAGQYTVHCYGAQGGDIFKPNRINNGGRGAYTKGTMTVTGNNTLFYAYVGGKGDSSPAGPNNGGFNGGGKSGRDKEGIIDDANDAPGGGGGATDLRIHSNSLESRIMVAAGGSGGAGACNGSYGGTYKLIYAISNNEFRESDDEGTLDGIGEDGDDGDYQPGSGGGGGYRGGRKGIETKLVKNNYLSVGYGGSSYISGDDYFQPNEKMIFKLVEMHADNNTGNGSLVVEQDFACSENCSACTSDSDCTECFEGFLINGQCKEDCPSGYANVGHECVACDASCGECGSSSDECTSCKNGFYLHGSSCIQLCPPGTAAITSSDVSKCVDCKFPCKTCSTSESACLSCANDSYVLYNGECVLTCPDGTIKTALTCERCQPFCKTCSESPINCLSCMDNFYLYKGKCLSSCPDKMYKSGRECAKCSSNCDSCSNAEDCLTCPDGLFLYEKRCYENCPDGTSSSGVGCLKNLP